MTLKEKKQMSSQLLSQSENKLYKIFSSVSRNSSKFPREDSLEDELYNIISNRK